MTEDKDRQKGQDTIGPGGERRDAELFEENLVDGAWIPLGFAWDSPETIGKRAREIEEFAADDPTGISKMEEKHDAIRAFGDLRHVDQRRGQSRSLRNPGKEDK